MNSIQEIREKSYNEGSFFYRWLLDKHELDNHVNRYLTDHYYNTKPDVGDIVYQVWPFFQDGNLVYRESEMLTFGRCRSYVKDNFSRTVDNRHLFLHLEDLMKVYDEFKKEHEGI